MSRYNDPMAQTRHASKAGGRQATSAPGASGAARPTGGVTEFEAIAVLEAVLTRGGKAADVVVGIGDDAAVFRRPSGELVCSVDSSLEGVHFDLRWLSAELAARRAMHAAVSDLAAMGAAPLGAVVALEVPRGTPATTFEAIAKGQARAVRESGCPIVGGNITRGERLGFTTTVLGTCKSGASVLRSGAQPGDEVWLSDPVGWAGLGLSVLQAGERSSADGRGETPAARWRTRAVRRWSTPSAKIQTGLEWASRANAMIDVSDSLASEARHLAEASRVSLVLDAGRLASVHRALFTACAGLGRDPWSLVLGGGEEYVLLATGRAERRPRGARVIGHVMQGQGTWLERDDGRVPLTAGFDHLSA